MTAIKKGTTHADAKTGAPQAPQTEAAQGAQAAQSQATPATGGDTAGGDTPAMVSAPAASAPAKRAQAAAHVAVKQPVFHGDEHHGRGGKYRLVDGKRVLVEATESPDADA